MKKLTKQQYNREALYYGTITGYQSLQNTSGENAALFREAHSDTGRRHSTDSDASQHGGSDHSLYGMGSTKNQRGNTGNDSSRNLPGSSSDTQRENGPSVTSRSNPTITENDSADADKRKFSARNSPISKRMTESEIRAVQSIGRKSVNAFSAADTKATERFAQRYWQEMGTKSPFFRAWFGDWRASDQTPVQVATQKGDARGVQKNEDTGWDIQVSSKVFNETVSHNMSFNKAAMPYLPYINDIVRKAVLLDSSGIDVGRAKSNNTLLMHSMYAMADIGNGMEIIKLYVEEMNNPNAENTGKRAYQLQNIEKYHFATKSSQNTASSRSVASGSANTVADLFATVKQKDKAFNPKPASKVVNPNGIPMVVYHGSAEEFNAFSYGRIGSASGVSILGEGFYFTDQRKLAKNYGQKVYPSYLQINSPY